MAALNCSITRLSHEADGQRCARLMASSEPWLTLGRTYEACLAIIQDPTREVYLLKTETDLAGFLIVCMTGAFVGYIQTICVDPARRGQGLGSMLVEFAERRILAESPNVFLCVSSFNPGARRLYERLGYQVIGELADYLVRGHSEILLRKTSGPLNGFRPRASDVGYPSRDGAPSGLKVGSGMREARLRPEFADLYPTLTPGQWEPAARVAEVVLARLLLLEISEAPLHDRLLNEEHFEFRGETPDGAPRHTRSRVADEGDS
ncbi:MAG TPA: GNAT family N-acetyltransferase [Gemmatimonadales bacterium]|nr:GNAT family N-acetyltransferase [Gemmatimonadales bacterium]